MTTISKNYQIVHSNKRVFLEIETTEDGTITHANLTIPALFETIQVVGLPSKLEILEDVRDAFHGVLSAYYEIFGGAE